MERHIYAKIGAVGREELKEDSAGCRLRPGAVKTVFLKAICQLLRRLDEDYTDAMVRVLGPDMKPAWSFRPAVPCRPVAHLTDDRAPVLGGICLALRRLPESYVRGLFSSLTRIWEAAQLAAENHETWLRERSTKNAGELAARGRAYDAEREAMQERIDKARADWRIAIAKAKQPPRNRSQLPQVQQQNFRLLFPSRFDDSLNVGQNVERGTGKESSMAAKHLGFRVAEAAAEILDIEADRHEANRTAALMSLLADGLRWRMTRHSKPIEAELSESLTPAGAVELYRKFLDAARDEAGLPGLDGEPAAWRFVRIGGGEGYQLVYLPRDERK